MSAHPIDESVLPGGGSPRADEPVSVDVSVLTPVLNEEAHIRDAVATMQAQEFDGVVEFLFIDGASTDRTKEILEDLQHDDPRIRIFDNPARLTPHGLNIGLEHARGEFVARMDAHTLYPTGYLQTGVERLRSGDVAWVSGPQIPHGSAGKWSRRIAMALKSPLGIGGASFRDATSEIETDTGFTGVWKRSTLLALGGWDDGWPRNQDSELAARVRDAGGKIVCVPSMGALYVPRNSLKKLSSQYRQYGRYREKTSRRHPGSMRRSHILPPITACAVVGGILPGRLGRSARAGTALYLLALTAGTVSAAAKLEPGERNPADIASLPLIWATMHLSWGLGFLEGCRRFGPPYEALGRIGRELIHRR